MNRIHKYKDFSKYDDMSWNLINSMQSFIKESESESDFKKVQKKVISDLKLNFRFIGSFGAGIGAFYPIVESLMKNLGKSIEITPEVVVLSTICALTIVYLEEKKFKDGEEKFLIEDSKSMLEELRMMGVGNGIIKKLVKSYKSILGIFNTIAKHIGSIASGFIDMFAYTSLLIPVMNGILYVINKYQLSIDTLIENFIGLSIGIGTVIAKHGISLIVSKLKDKFEIDKKEVVDDIDTSDDVVKFGDIKVELYGGDEMITEQ